VVGKQARFKCPTTYHINDGNFVKLAIGANNRLFLRLAVHPNALLM
jgi:hypothetical protein